MECHFRSGLDESCGTSRQRSDSMPFAVQFDRVRRHRTCSRSGRWHGRNPDAAKSWSRVRASASTRARTRSESVRCTTCGRPPSRPGRAATRRNRRGGRAGRADVVGGRRGDRLGGHPGRHAELVIVPAEHLVRREPTCVGGGWGAVRCRVDPPTPRCARWPRARATRFVVAGAAGGWAHWPYSSRGTPARP